MYSINKSIDKPFLSIQMYIDHMSTYQKSSQSIIQALKKKVDDFEEKEKVSDKQIQEEKQKNSELQREMNKKEEMIKQQGQEIKRLQQEINKREGILKQILPISQSIEKACKTIHSDIEKINPYHVPMYNNLLRNISGASNFSLQEISRLQSLLYIPVCLFI